MWDWRKEAKRRLADIRRMLHPELGEPVSMDGVKAEIRKAMDSCPARRLCQQYRLEPMAEGVRLASDVRPPAGALVLYPTGRYDEWDIGEYVAPDVRRPSFHRIRTFTPGRLEMTVGEIRPVTDKFKVW